MYDQALTLAKEQKEGVREIALPSCKWHKEKFCHKIMLLPGLTAIVVRFQKDQNEREKICDYWFYPASITQKEDADILNLVTRDFLRCWDDVKEEVAGQLVWFSQILEKYYPDQKEVKAIPFYRFYYSLVQKHRNCEDNIKVLMEFRQKRC